MSWSEAIERVDSGFAGEARPPGAPEQVPHFVDIEQATEELPPRARERLLVLRQRYDDVRASIEGVMRQRDQAWGDAATRSGSFAIWSTRIQRAATKDRTPTRRCSAPKRGSKVPAITAGAWSSI